MADSYRIGIIGVGLIGGSIARAARLQGVATEIIGFDSCSKNLLEALRLGVVDRIAESASAAAEQADLVVIAVPVGVTQTLFESLKPIWSDQVLYTDAGSTKLDVLAAARRCFGRVPENFVPGHPVAGAESSGVGAASDSLFVNKRVILTPHPDNDDAAVKKISAFWSALGGRVSLMDAAHHDAVLAATSHLPHVLAFALVHLLGCKDDQQEIFQYAAGGFRDFTRIASSDPRMWADICLANRDFILPLIEDLSRELREVSEIIKLDDNPEHLLHYFSDARKARQRFLDQLIT
ncbi:prephenate dehydrogenase/arogenate dehydrogenase family protein [Candidatus Methylospira mobilis]|uniref:prephenate dehydrogenase n=1 Tax=Candidatus Methylospira mobilis TaxID=1808979 RepID=A0A5Q0BSF3_9GAMM|nr:prephenate dehydrogenase/arogenate dehydrogenase family protein [Candidatus Methylospira mobilis]QFY45008.1 prephenate dehydrogenase/arogenate dehydrogenase family protein [Candidatus Methylospira mobilis]WNV06889.1 prephenate dehydrogenase/arogenate dehydrogenase family protein [Candidatus Methylospira mobilis]